MCPSGDLDKYKSDISTSMCLSGDLNKYKFDISTSMCPLGDLNKYKSDISTSMCPSGDLKKYRFAISTSKSISLLYESMQKSRYLLLYICYCYMLIVSVYQCMFIRISYMSPNEHKA